MNLIKDFNEGMSAFGSGVFYISLLIVLFRFNFDLAIKFLLVLIFVELISGGIKLIYHKPRPIQRKNQTIFDTEKMIFAHAQGFNPEKAKSFSRCSRTQTRSGIYFRVLDRWDAGSFPSIHTARITAIAVTLNYAFFDPVMAVLSVFIVLSVGYSRVYLKHHYLSDVIGGFLIGLIIGVGGMFV